MVQFMVEDNRTLDLSFIKEITVDKNIPENLRTLEKKSHIFH